MKEREHFLPLHIGDDFVQHYLNRIFLYWSQSGYSDFSPEMISRRDNIITSSFTFSHRRGAGGISYSESGGDHCLNIELLAERRAKLGPGERLRLLAELFHLFRRRGLSIRFDILSRDGYVWRLFKGYLWPYPLSYGGRQLSFEERVLYEIKRFCCLVLLMPGGSVIAEKIMKDNWAESDYLDFISQRVLDEWVFYLTEGPKFFGIDSINIIDICKRFLAVPGFYIRDPFLILRIASDLFYDTPKMPSIFANWFIQYFQSLGIDYGVIRGKMYPFMEELYKAVPPSSSLSIPYTWGWYDFWWKFFWYLYNFSEENAPSSIRFTFPEVPGLVSREEKEICMRIIKYLTQVRLFLATHFLQTILERGLLVEANTDTGRLTLFQYLNVSGFFHFMWFPIELSSLIVEFEQGLSYDYLDDYANLLAFLSGLHSFEFGDWSGLSGPSATNTLILVVLFRVWPFKIVAIDDVYVLRLGSIFGDHWYCFFFTHDWFPYGYAQFIQVKYGVMTCLHKHYGIYVRVSLPLTFPNPFFVVYKYVEEPANISSVLQRRMSFTTMAMSGDVEGIYSMLTDGFEDLVDQALSWLSLNSHNIYNYGSRDAVGIIELPPLFLQGVRRLAQEIVDKYSRAPELIKRHVGGRFIGAWVY